MKRIAEAVSAVDLPLQVKFLPMQAHWFALNALTLANQANRDGMHANALALTRQCVEAISVVEIGLCRHADAAETLLQWNDDRLSAGELRKWLSVNVWPNYGSGLWVEPWTDFMAQFAKAVQPYAHYSSKLAMWQWRLHGQAKPDDESKAIVQIGPNVYDPQKATRITLFHSILAFVLARIWTASTKADDDRFAALSNRLRIALGKSEYLDGHETEWAQQFWAMLWLRGGGTILE